MRVILTLLFTLILAGCGGGDAPMREAGAGEPVRAVALGDSITLRTGLCPAGMGLAECLDRQQLDTATSYATHLANASGGAITLLDNQGRGGDTCTRQPAWTTGPHIGEPRGMEARLVAVREARPNTVLLMAGINDVMVWGVTPADAAMCVAQMKALLEGRGIKVVVLTYPPITADTPVFAIAPDRLARHAALNAELRRIGAVDPLYWPSWAAKYLTTDGTHTSPAGAVWMAQAIAKSMEHR